MTEQIEALPEPRLWYDPETQRCSSMAPLRPTYEPLWDEQDMHAFRAEGVAAERTAWLAANGPGGWIDDLRREVETPSPTPVEQPPEGWVMVPVEPTPDMVKAGWRGADATRCYHAMLSAAPKPKDQPAIDMDELRRAVCLIGTIGTIDGHDVIRRNSALEIIDARIDRAST